MSDQWSQGYFTDVGYTYGYYRELSPVFQKFCLVVKGVAPPDTDSPVCCELGFGQGVSINIHGAAIPGKFVGNDFNPEHAAYAESLARKSGNNALLTDDSFEQLLERSDLPQFDYISLHGIWSWVSLENQKFIVEFARRKLKPGGVLYVSYNCFPGWAAYIPLRQAFALHDRFADRSKPAAQRVDAALAFTERMFATKPRYVSTAAGVEGRLEKIKDQNRNYLAHEYFNREWNTMYFMDVVDALAPAKLNFAVSANPLDQIDAVNLTAEQAAFLGTIDNPLFREQARDYIVNNQFRKDIYMRGVRRLKPRERIETLMEMRFALAVPLSTVVYTLTSAIGEVSLREDIYKPLVEALAATAHAPKTLRQVQANMPQELPFDAILQALVVLVAQGWAVPCQTEAASKAAKPVSDRLNLEIMRQSMFSNEAPMVLASPVSGSGHAVRRFHQLFLLAKGRKAQDPVRFAQEVMKANNERAMKDGKPLMSDEENIAFLAEQYAEFQNTQLPILKALGIG